MSGWELEKKDIRALAERLGVEPCAVAALIRVESAGSGFIEPGMPKILFEGHIFWKELKKVGLKPENFAADHPSVLFSKWDKKHYRGGRGEYERLVEAEAIHRDAAQSSASWGAFQIMGFNYAACGFSGVGAFVEAQKAGAAEQARVFGEFLRSQRLVRFLQARDWAGFAERYNGSAYAANKYDEKLRAAYERCVAEEGRK